MSNAEDHCEQLIEENNKLKAEVERLTGILRHNNVCQRCGKGYLCCDCRE